jgi:hypothetical protein
MIQFIRSIHLFSILTFALLLSGVGLLDAKQPAQAKPDHSASAMTGDPLPMQKNIKVNQKITLDGALIIFNGWPPNLRFVTADNFVIGIGKNEDIDLPEQVVKFLRPENEIVGRLELKYIGSVTIPYYDNPLLCFDIVKFLKLKVKKRTDKEWKTIY